MDFIEIWTLKLYYQPVITSKDKTQVTQVRQADLKFHFAMVADISMPAVEREHESTAASLVFQLFIQTYPLSPFWFLLYFPCPKHKVKINYCMQSYIALASYKVIHWLLFRLETLLVQWQKKMLSCSKVNIISSSLSQHWEGRPWWWRGQPNFLVLTALC